MSKTLSTTVSGLALAVGLGGCNGQSTPEKPAPTPQRTTAQVDAAIDASLQRLRALQVYDVERLVLDVPGDDGACYGLPCPGPTTDAARARQEPRLARLATLAEAVHARTDLPAHTLDETAAAAAALSALRIVQVTRLVEVQPKSSPECYNLPCPGDEATAQQQNERAVAEAFAVTAAAQAEKL
jgi:hypothetical protein